MGPLGYASRLYKSGHSRFPGRGETRMAPQNALRALRVSREKSHATLFEAENLDRHGAQLKSVKGGDFSRHPSSLFVAPPDKNSRPWAI